MLRVHFTAEDLPRTRVASTFNPFWEMVFSRMRLVEDNPPVNLRPWRDQVRSSTDRVLPGVQALAVLSPLGPYFPDFITPSEGLEGFDAGLEAILNTPPKRLNEEITKLAARSPVPSWAHRLATGEISTLTRLGSAMRSYYAATIQPYFETVHAEIEIERARRARDLHTGGVEGLLRGMAPLMQWRPPVLEVYYDTDRDLHLRGRGLLLVPSYFCRRSPVALADVSLPPTLLYPIDRQQQWQGVINESLTALLGATRATVLTSIDGGTTTTELARRAATSLASASRHAQVLREAGLITTERRGTAVRHTLTPLGMTLLSRNHSGR